MNRINLRPSAIIICIIGLFILSGCGTSNIDFNPGKVHLQEKLPALEPLINLNSFENAYLKESATNMDVLFSAIQPYKNYFMDDATFVFYKDVMTNIIDTLSDDNGYIVCRINSQKQERDSEFGYLCLALGTAFAVPFCGGPAFSYTSDVSVEVELRDIKKEYISSFVGRGQGTTYGNGLYYAPNYRDANVQAIRNALDEIKLKMSYEATNIKSSLNKGMEKIKLERDLAQKQSELIPVQLVNGNMKFSAKEYNSAIQSYDSALSDNPYHIYALLNRGKAKSEMGKNHAAIKDFSRVIELDPKNVEAYSARGAAYCNLKELYAAVYNYGKAIKLAPDMADLYLIRAGAEEDLRLYENSAKDYETALKLNPDLSFAKERWTAVKNYIRLEREQQIARAQQEEQERQERINQMNAALNSLSNSLNSLSNSNNSQTPAVQQSPANSNSGHIERNKCSYCNGSGLDPAPSYAASFGLPRTSNGICNTCGKPNDHYHKKCPSCNGKGYREKFVR